MFTISDLSPQERRDLALNVGCSPMYLWQISSGRRTPSMKLLRKLTEADRRLSAASFLYIKKP
jgi:transcriptional regulator with XRE-family HTH domain